MHVVFHIQICVLMVGRGGTLRSRLSQAGNEEPPTHASVPEAPSNSRSIRQRVAEADPFDAHNSQPLPLTDLLKRYWATGKLNSKQVQQYAFAARSQGAQHLDDLAGAGAEGNRPQHIQRTLLRLFGRPVGAPEITWISIPTTKGQMPHPFILPHKFFRSLYRGRRDIFGDCVAGPRGSALEYWTAVQGTAFVKEHPSLKEENWARTIPVGFHWNAGSCNKQESILVLSWNSLLGRGNTRRKRFIFTIISKSLYTNRTLDVIWKVFGWSMN